MAKQSATATNPVRARRQHLAAKVRRLGAAIQAHPLRWLMGVLLFTLINGYIIYVLYRDREQFAAIDWSHFSPGWLVVSSLVQFAGLLTALLGWRYVLYQFGYRISFRRHFKIYTLSNLAKKLPGAVWHIVGRTYMYRQDGGNEIQVSVTTVSEIVVFGLAGVIVAFLMMLMPSSPPIEMPVWVMGGVLLLVAMLVPSPLFRRALNWLNRGSDAPFQLRWQHLAVWLAINIVTIALGGVTLFCFAYAMGRVDYGALVGLTQGWALLVAVGTLFAWIPGGGNLLFGVMMVFLSTMMPAPEALVLLVAWRLWTTLNEVVWGGIGFVL
ncbi:MAG: flippase-like domain-containing protein [Chloroflexaceae bacterium]|nr:flippase-like domain-containing protein [Chloroflexaceae bacterium]